MIHDSLIWMAALTPARRGWTTERRNGGKEMSWDRELKVKMGLTRALAVSLKEDWDTFLKDNQ